MLYYYYIFVGVNAQLILNKKIIIRTLGMVTMKDRQTSENIKIEVKNILSRYDLSLEHIYTITVDNGGNMVKCVQLIEDEVIEDTEESESVVLQDEANDELIEDSFENIQLPCMRCAAHTLQLAANIILKNTVFSDIIKFFRMIACKCRNVKYQYLFQQSKIPYPKLDVETRWGSTYILLKFFEEKASFFENLGIIHKELLISRDHWTFLRKYVSAMKPIYITTLKFQEEQLLMGSYDKFYFLGSNFQFQELNFIRDASAIS
jgi:hypothetical protein